MTACVVEGRAANGPRSGGDFQKEMAQLQRDSRTLNALAVSVKPLPLHCDVWKVVGFPTKGKWCSYREIV